MSLLNIIEMSLTKLLSFIIDYVTNEKKRGGNKWERKAPKIKTRARAWEIFFLRCAFFCVSMTTTYIVLDNNKKYDLWGVSAPLKTIHEACH